METISIVLQLPSDQSLWENERADLQTRPERVDGDAPPLGRPVWFSLKGGAYADIANADFDDLFQQATPLSEKALHELGFEDM